MAASASAAAHVTDDFLDIKLVTNKANSSEPLTWLPYPALLPFLLLLLPIAIIVLGFLVGCGVCC